MKGSFWSKPTGAVLHQSPYQRSREFLSQILKRDPHAEIRSVIHRGNSPLARRRLAAGTASIDNAVVGVEPGYGRKVL